MTPPGFICHERPAKMACEFCSKNTIDDETLLKKRKENFEAHLVSLITTKIWIPSISILELKTSWICTQHDWGYGDKCSV